MTNYNNLVIFKFNIIIVRIDTRFRLLQDIL